MKFLTSSNWAGLGLLLCFYTMKPAWSGNSTLGINLAWVGHPTSNEWIFTDMMRMGSSWYVQDTGGGSFGRPDSTFRFNENGYPTSMPSDKRLISMIFNRIDGNYPAGEYLFLYEGTGTVFPTWDAEITSQDPGRMTVNVTPSNDGVAIYLEQTDSLDPIRNIRLIMPGFHDTYQTQIFHPDFLSRWKPFEVVRFMMWQAIQSSPIQTWTQRSTPNHYIQGSEKGVALELMIALANELQCDVWFNMPHQSNDDYIQNFASMVKDSIHQSATVYIEYSNEVWNPSDEYQQSAYARDQGLALSLSTDSALANRLFNTRRSLEIFTIWENVFENSSRLKKIIGTQTGGPPELTEAMLDYQNAYQKIDALTVGNYLMWDYDRFFDGSSFMDSIASLSVDSIYVEMEKMLHVTDSLVHLQRKIAQDRGLEVMVYEGGQHLVPFGDESEEMERFTTKMLEVNRDNRIKGIYKKMLANWDSAGGGAFMHFNSTEAPAAWGWFGTFENMLQDSSGAPKYQALIEYIEGDSISGSVPPFYSNYQISPHLESFELFTINGRKNSRIIKDFPSLLLFPVRKNK